MKTEKKKQQQPWHMEMMNLINVADKQTVENSLNETNTMANSENQKQKKR